MKKRVVFILFITFLFYLQGYGQEIEKLSVKGTQLSNKSGVVQLKGMSSHGLQWFPWCKETVKNLKNQWGANVVRAAMYTSSGGYISHPSKMKEEVYKIVDAAINEGIYVIIDWHILSDGNPNTYRKQARAFFREMAKKYGKYNNVIYEICNEPNGVGWSEIKRYAEYIISAIRAIDPDNIIIVGTDTWSQGVDNAAKAPLSGDNIMYALHFYTGTHKESLRQRAENALKKGLPIFVSEWGTSSASGDGGPFLDEAKKWVDWMNRRNISWCNWSLANKAEVSAALKPGVSLCGPWSDSDLSRSGRFIKKIMKSPHLSNIPKSNNTKTNIPKPNNPNPDHSISEIGSSKSNPLKINTPNKEVLVDLSRGYAWVRFKHKPIGWGIVNNGKQFKVVVMANGKKSSTNKGMWWFQPKSVQHSQLVKIVRKGGADMVKVKYWK